MLEDKLRSTDWEATYEAIEEAVARESYLTWLREQEKRTGTSRQGLQVRGERKGGKRKVAEVFNSVFTWLFPCHKSVVDLFDGLHLRCALMHVASELIISEWYIYIKYCFQAFTA